MIHSIKKKWQVTNLLRKPVVNMDQNKEDITVVLMSGTICCNKKPDNSLDGVSFNENS